MGRLKAPSARLSAAPRVVGYATRQEAERSRNQVRRQMAKHNLRGLYNTKRRRHPETGVRTRILVRDCFTCRMCQVALTGKYPAPDSPVADHITPHKGNLVLFWSEDRRLSTQKRHARELR